MPRYLGEGDSLYIFTDGYADQFGGDPSTSSVGKKFKYTSMRDLFVSINHLPMKEQKEKLNDVIEGWMHNSFEQIDDTCPTVIRRVCIIGVRI